MSRTIFEHNEDATLMIACENGDSEMVDILLLKPDVDVNRANVQNMSALMYAVAKGYKHIVQALLRHATIDVNISNNDGNNALMIACKEGYSELVKILICIPGVDVNRSNKDSMTALMLASAGGPVESVQALLQHPLIDLSIVNEAGLTAQDLAKDEYILSALAIGVAATIPVDPVHAHAPNALEEDNWNDPCEVESADTPFPHPLDCGAVAKSLKDHVITSDLSALESPVVSQHPSLPLPSPAPHEKGVRRFSASSTVTDITVDSPYESMSQVSARPLPLLRQHSDGSSTTTDVFHSSFRPPRSNSNESEPDKESWASTPSSYNNSPRILSLNLSAAAVAAAEANLQYEDGFFQQIDSGLKLAFSDSASSGNVSASTAVERSVMKEKLVLALTSLSPTMDVGPRLVMVLPTPRTSSSSSWWWPSIRSEPKGLGVQLYFLCTHTHQIAPCGQCGKGIPLRLDPEFFVTTAPVLRVGLAVAKLSLMDGLLCADDSVTPELLQAAYELVRPKEGEYRPTEGPDLHSLLFSMYSEIRQVVPRELQSKGLRKIKFTWVADEDEVERKYVLSLEQDRAMRVSRSLSGAKPVSFDADEEQSTTYEESVNTDGRTENLYGGERHPSKYHPPSFQPSLSTILASPRSGPSASSSPIVQEMATFTLSGSTSSTELSPKGPPCSSTFGKSHIDSGAQSEKFTWSSHEVFFPSSSKGNPHTSSSASAPSTPFAEEKKRDHVVTDASEQARRQLLDDAFHTALEAADEAAVSQLTAAALTGDHLAEAYLSILYEHGCPSLPTNLSSAQMYAESALSYLKFESFHNDPFALYCMGQLHSFGLEVEFSGVQAVHFYRRATELGHSGARKALQILQGESCGAAEPPSNAVPVDTATPGSELDAVTFQPYVWERTDGGCDTDSFREGVWWSYESWACDNTTQTCPGPCDAEERSRREALHADFLLVQTGHEVPSTATTAAITAAAAASLMDAALTGCHLAEAYLSILLAAGCADYPTNLYHAHVYAGSAYRWLKGAAFHGDACAKYCLAILFPALIVVDATTLNPVVLVKEGGLHSKKSNEINAIEVFKAPIELDKCECVPYTLPLDFQRGVGADMSSCSDTDFWYSDEFVDVSPAAQLATRRKLEETRLSEGESARRAQLWQDFLSVRAGPDEAAAAARLVQSASVGDRLAAGLLSALYDAGCTAFPVSPYIAEVYLQSARRWLKHEAFHGDAHASFCQTLLQGAPAAGADFMVTAALQQVEGFSDYYSVDTMPYYTN